MDRSLLEAWKGAVVRAVEASKLGIINPDGRLMTGSVMKVYKKGEEGYGTVDVREFVTDYAESEEDALQRLKDGTCEGYHKNVRLSTLHSNNEGYLLIPKLHSTVGFVVDPKNGAEYVTFVSQVDIVQLDAHETVAIGVREREEYDAEDVDGPTVDELMFTGASARTEYTKDAAVTTVCAKEDDDKATIQRISQEGYQLTKDKSKLSVEESKASMNVDSCGVIVDNGKVELGKGNGSEDAVLGQQLASILIDLVSYIGQITTVTMAGPMPPVNLAQFIALQAKIQAFANSHSGFLAPSVQIKK